jgi:hypothetical protein
MARRIRVERSIIYEGDPEWVAKVLSASLLKPGMSFPCAKGTIHLHSEFVTVNEFTIEDEIPEVPYGA